jgi:hypothetical protein
MEVVRPSESSADFYWSTHLGDSTLYGHHSKNLKSNILIFENSNGIAEGGRYDQSLDMDQTTVVRIYLIYMRMIFVKNTEGEELVVNILEQIKVEMNERGRDMWWFLRSIKEPMFRGYVIHTERGAIFKPYILSSSKETALTFER